MGLSVPTVTKIIEELCAEGYVEDCGKLETAGGRHPSLYGLNAESGYFVGVDLKQDSLSFALINFKGDVLRLEMRVPFMLDNTMEAVDRLSGEINRFVDSLSVKRDKILNVCVGMSGRVNPKKGCNYTRLNFGDKHPISSLLAKRVGLSVCVDNDSRAMAYGEFMKRSERCSDNLIFINVNWGLGMAFIVDGKLYNGMSGFSGEFGHNYGYDNQQGWKTDTAWFDSKGKNLLGVPWHGVVFRNIQFELIRFDFNQNRTCIALKSKNLPDAPAQTAEIPLEGQFRGVAFLHAVTHGKAGETAMKYHFTYEDGSSVTVPIVVGKEIGDWRIRNNPPAVQEQTAWQKFGNGFFLYEWNNPQPAKKLKSLRIESGYGESVPIVVGISSLPTRFTKSFRTSIPMQKLFEAVSTEKSCGWQKDGTLVCGPASVSLKVRDGRSLRIPEDRLKNAVLRFQLKHGKDQWGKQYPKSGYVWMTMFGKRDGKQVSSATQGSNVTAQIFSQQVSWFKNPADWNEVELPLDRLANFQAEDLPVIAEIISLSYAGGDRVHILKDFRLEY